MILDKDTMLDEIGNLAYSSGDATRVEDPTGHIMHQYFDIVEDDNIKRVDRTMILAMQRCERLLHRWTKFPKLKRHHSMDNRRDDRPELLMELRVGDKVSETVAESLLALVNEFVEIFVLRDWAGITYKEAYDYWDLRLRETEEQLLECLDLGDDDEDAVLYCGW